MARTLIECPACGNEYDVLSSHSCPMAFASWSASVDKRWPRISRGISNADLLDLIRTTLKDLPYSPDVFNVDFANGQDS